VSSRTVAVPRQRSARGRTRRDVGDRLNEAAHLVARALALADRDPETAERLARHVLRRGSLPPELRLDARLALGRAAWVRRDTAAAVSALRAAVRLADAAGFPQRAAHARLTLAAALAERGRTRAALTALSAAEPHLTGVDLARLAGQRAYVHHLEGRLGEALTGYRSAHDAFRQLGDEVRQAVALHNVALLHTHAGALGQAAAELARARELFERAGEARHAADAAANLGWVLARQGLVPQALRWFDVADAALGPHAGGDPEAAWHRAEALLDARMLVEAWDAARAAASGAAARGTPGPAVECSLLAARIALLQGDLGAAREQAAAAQRAAGTRFPALGALARHVSLVADLESGVRGTAAARARRSALRVWDLLAEEGWQLQALGARVVAARLALAAGRPDAARSDLAGAIVVRAGSPLQLRIAATHARALLHVVEGDRAAASAALRAGVRDLDQHRLSLGATELQTLATGHALELLGLGLDLALEAGDAWEVLTWSERGRAASLRARPPDDPALTESLDALRQSAAVAERALLDGSDPRRALARQVALEREVRRRSLTAQAPDRPGTPSPGVRLDRARVRRALGEGVLLQLVEHRGHAYGVLVRGAAAPGRSMLLRDLGPVEPIAAELDALRFAATRLARSTGSARALEAAGAGYATAAARIDAALLAPFGSLLQDRPLVLTPSGPWHAVPWSALPTCAGRVVEVAPSTGLWLRTTGAGPADGGVVIAAGPGLEDAGSEVAGVLSVLPGARTLEGEDATAGAVLDALDGAALAHLAAHGSFRADNPQLSALRLADGPLTVYDLETLRTPPRTLVLTACDVGLSRVHTGEEVQGFAAALLTLGARAVVASVAPVADDLAAGLAVDLHRELRGHDRVAPALSAVQGRWRGNGPRAAATAASFVCFGGG
jgi:tetratricopeptide (TPR) repeat protein